MAVWRLIAHHEDADSQIQAFLDLGWIAIGWTDVGDLRLSRPSSASEITDMIQAVWPGSDNAHLGGPSLWRLYTEMRVGDLVILGDGQHRRAVMRVAGDYVYRPEDRSVAFQGYGHWRRAEYVACHAEALWQSCGAALAPGESVRWTLVRCGGHSSTSIAPAEPDTAVDGPRL